MWHVGRKVMEICNCSPELRQKKLMNNQETLPNGQKDNFELAPNGRLEPYRSLVSEEIQSQDMIYEEPGLRKQNKFRQRIDEVCEYYINHSTFHGFHNIFKSKSLLRKALWLIILAVASGAFFYEMKKSVSQYVAYPFSTMSRLEYAESVVFPAVSVCDFNDIRNIAFKDKLNDGRAAKGRIMEPLNMNMDELLKRASKRFESSIVRCAWKLGQTSTPCTGSNFSVFIYPSGEACHTFNSGLLKGQEVLNATNTGPKYGLTLHLDILQANYSKDVRQSGFRIILHQQGELPLKKEGFRVPPGYVTYVDLIEQKIHNLPYPYSTNCGGKQLKYFPTYSRTNCYLESLTDYVKEKCGCVGWFMPGGKGANMCEMTKTFECMWPAWEQFDRNHSIRCPVDCEVVTYTPKLSSALFNPQKLLPDPKFHWLLNAEGMPKDLSGQLQFMRDNYVVINLYLEELRYEEITQLPSYSFYRLVGDLGGQLGLVLGASCISIIEILDVFALSLYYWIRYKKTRGREDGLNI